MNTYDEKHIKNIALVGASKSGMTTLSEAMHYEAGQIKRIGTIETGSTVSDYHEVEKAKGISVYTTPLHLEWKHYKINVLDAPGIDDFYAEALNAIRIADTSVLLVNASKGVEVTTQLLWNSIDKRHKPVVIAINQLDHPHAQWEESLKSVRELVGSRLLPLQFPIETGEKFHEIVDALTMKLYRFKPEGGKPEKLEIPEEYKAQAEEMHREIVEAAAANKEELLEHYLEQGNLTEEELQEGLRIGMTNHEIFPVFCLSAKNDMGSGRLMGFIDYVTPSPTEMPPYLDASGPASLYVFKTGYEQNLGKVSYFKVMSGTLKSGSRLTNLQIDGNPEESLGQLYLMDGKNRTPVDALKVGDLGAVIKLKETMQGHTLSEDKNGTVHTPMEYPEDRIVKAIDAGEDTDVEKVATALRRLEEQDPSFRYMYDGEQNQMLVGTQGEVHLDVNKWILENEYNLSVEFSDPKVAYREGIMRSAVGFYRHKKQSGGAGQFAEVKLRIEPWTEGMNDPEGFPVRGKELHDLPWGGKLEVINSIVGGVIDQRFIPSITKGVIEAMESGPITESPVQNVRIIIFDGKMHAVDSNDVAFKIAGNHAFKEALNDAKPMLMEPILEAVVTVPEFALGGVLTEIQSRRAVVLGIEPNGTLQRISMQIPKAETMGMFSELRSLSHGQVGYTSKFLELRPAPNKQTR